MILDLGDASMALTFVPSGCFSMGSGNSDYAEAPERQVCIETAFWLGQTPVTQAQWHAVMGENPATFQESQDHPVEGVSFDAAQSFCRRLSGTFGRPVRLPSEAEWEYACRAGSTSEFFFGPWGPFADSGEIPWAVQTALCDHAWFDLNSQRRPWPVRLKRPNMWGLHDMIGNVWEWCQDGWVDDYAGAPLDGSARRPDPGQPRRVLRGGAWDMDAFRCRSTYRSFDHRTVATDRIGLRIALDSRGSDRA